MLACMYPLVPLGLDGCCFATFVLMECRSEVQPFCCFACLLVLAAVVAHDVHLLCGCFFTCAGVHKGGEPVPPPYLKAHRGGKLLRQIGVSNEGRSCSRRDGFPALMHFGIGRRERVHAVGNINTRGSVMFPALVRFATRRRQRVPSPVHTSTTQRNTFSAPVQTSGGRRDMLPTHVRFSTGGRDRVPIGGPIRRLTPFFFMEQLSVLALEG